MPSTGLNQVAADFLTVGEAAAKLGVSRSTLRNWDKAGKLKPHRHPLNDYRLYRRIEVEELLAKVTGIQKVKMKHKTNLPPEEVLFGEKKRAERNRTLTANTSEVAILRDRLLTLQALQGINYINRTILADCFDVFRLMKPESVDLLILDPPYNLNKKFGANKFSRVPVDQYTSWLRKLFLAAKELMKPTGSLYICGDWLSSTSIFIAASEFFEVRNRITWEREKGRGALKNWKNSSEDIWFCTMSDSFTFNVEGVKLRRRIIAPYRHADGRPKDWVETNQGNFRDTHPSNLWTDITIPFWSMPENTDHPTQKSEKLVAKLMLASTNPGDFVLDPFLGSGTSSVVAKKLGRRFCGIELDEAYAILAEKRLSLVERDKSIQGYRDQVFWERNTLNVISNIETNKVA